MVKIIPTDDRPHVGTFQSVFSGIFDLKRLMNVFTNNTSKTSFQVIFGRISDPPLGSLNTDSKGWNLLNQLTDAQLGLTFVTFRTGSQNLEQLKTS